MWLIIVTIVIWIFCMMRIHIVAAQRMKVMDKVLEYNLKQLHEGKIPEVIDFYEVVLGFDEHMFKFWLWGERSAIKKQYLHLFESYL